MQRKRRSDPGQATEGTARVLGKSREGQVWQTLLFSEVFIVIWGLHGERNMFLHAGCSLGTSYKDNDRYGWVLSGRRTILEGCLAGIPKKQGDAAG